MKTKIKSIFKQIDFKYVLIFLIFAFLIFSPLLKINIVNVDDIRAFNYSSRANSNFEYAFLQANGRLPMVLWGFIHMMPYYIFSSNYVAIQIINIIFVLINFVLFGHLLKKVFNFNGTILIIPLIAMLVITFPYGVIVSFQWVMTFYIMLLFVSLLLYAEHVKVASFTKLFLSVSIFVFLMFLYEIVIALFPLYIAILIQSTKLSWDTIKVKLKTLIPYMIAIIIYVGLYIIFSRYFKVDENHIYSGTIFSLSQINIRDSINTFVNYTFGFALTTIKTIKGTPYVESGLYDVDFLKIAVILLSFTYLHFKHFRLITNKPSNHFGLFIFAITMLFTPAILYSITPLHNLISMIFISYVPSYFSYFGLILITYIIFQQIVGFINIAWFKKVATMVLFGVLVLMVFAVQISNQKTTVYLNNVTNKYTLFQDFLKSEILDDHEGPIYIFAPSLWGNKINSYDLIMGQVDIKNDWSRFAQQTMKREDVFVTSSYSIISENTTFFHYDYYQYNNEEAYIVMEVDATLKINNIHVKSTLKEVTLVQLFGNEIVYQEKLPTKGKLYNSVLNQIDFGDNISLLEFPPFYTFNRLNSLDLSYLNEIGSSRFIPFDRFLTVNGEYLGNSIYLDVGDVAYGPFSTLHIGNYRVTFIYESRSPILYSYASIETSESQFGFIYLHYGNQIEFSLLNVTEEIQFKIVCTDDNNFISFKGVLLERIG